MMGRFIVAPVIRSKENDMHTFHVADMTCGGCAAAITQAIRQVDPSAAVEAAPATKLVKVESQLPPASIAQAIATAGYRVAE